MADFPTHSEVRLGEQGRLVIPADLRKSLGFELGDTLIARLEDGRLVLEKQENVQRRLKARFSRIIKDTSLADELIAQRREEANWEIGE